MQLTGEVRRIDTEAIQQRLDDGDIVLISPIGYSPTGEIFNLTVEEVATQVAVRLEATKLIFLMDADGVRNGRRQLLTDLSTTDAEALLAKGDRLTPDVRLYLPAAIRACNNGVKRAHLISRRLDGALLLELFTRDGVGTMIASTALANIRSATIDDVGGILAIIEPLEEQGVLVRRSRERLESEIERFVVAEYDGHIIGCAALYAFPDEKVGELAALAVQPDFRREGYGEALMREIETRARRLKLAELFVLTTKTAHWFLERGFRSATSPICRSRSSRSTITSASRWSTANRCKDHTDGPHGPMRQARPRGRRSRFPALPGRARQAHLRERVEGSVAAWLRHQTMLVNENRLSLADAARPQVARRADGEALLRRRRRNAERLRAAYLTNRAEPAYNERYGGRGGLPGGRSASRSDWRVVK